MSTEERNETFVRLVQILRDDLKLVQLVDKMVHADPFHKNLLIVEVTTEMIQSGEPQSTIDAIKLLGEPGVLEKIVDIILTNKNK